MSKNPWDLSHCTSGIIYISNVNEQYLGDYCCEYCKRIFDTRETKSCPGCGAGPIRNSQ